MPIQIGNFHISLDLHMKQGQEKEKTRIALKKILIVLPPWRRGANFVGQNLENLAYTPEEQENLIKLRAEAETRQAEVEREIVEGASPWLAKVKHNEQNALNPITIGFYQMPDGQIRTIFGSRYFQSKRQIKTDGLLYKCLDCGRIANY